MLPLVRLLNLSGCPDSRDSMREGTQWRSWGSVGEDPVPEDPPQNKLNKFLVRVHKLFMNLFKKDFCTFFVLRTVHELFMKLFKLVKFDS